MLKFFKTLIPESCKDRIRYHRYSKNYTRSQAGQDFWVYGEAFNEMRNGFFVEVGSSNGYALNNTFLLEANYNWRGICIEANPRTFMGLQNLRRSTCLNLCIDSEEGVIDFVDLGATGGIVALDTDNKYEDIVGNETAIIRLKTTTLEKVLDEHNAPREIDYLSIDVEGAEERVLSNFDFEKYLFRCISIERPTDVLRKVLHDQGYLIIKEIPGLDVFYIHGEFQDTYLRNLSAFWGK